MDGDTDAAWAAAEQRLRTQTYDPEQQFTSDALWQVPPDPMYGRQTVTGPWRGARQVPLDALRPAAVAGLFVLGACADLPRADAEHLLQPGVSIALGERVGQAAVQEAARQPAPVGVRLPGTPTSQPVARGEVREVLAGVRPSHKYPTLPQDARSLPVLGRYDVVVVGGGTCGAPAAIASARQGAKTLVIEQHHGLGGLGTLGTVAFYFWGNRCGFNNTTPAPGSTWIIEQKMQWWRNEFLKAGGELWFGCIGCGAFVENGRVCGVIVATPRGRGLILAKAVVDTTGNADIAAAAGAACLYTDHRDFALMGAGVPPRNLGANHGGADYCIVDETDMVDVWHLHVYAKDKHPKAFDQGPIIDTRERRRIVGDHTLTILDEVNERTYPDTIAVAHSPYDLGVAQCSTIDPALLAVDPARLAVGTRGKRYVNIPYRCCLPKGLDGIFVAALGLSAEHDAIPMIRMQADLENLGYAVGVAAAMTARSDVPTRQIDMRALQRHLIEIENVPERVLTDKDSYPLPAEAVAEAVRSLKTNLKGAPVILAQPKQALPLLRTAYAASEGSARLTYAKLLGILRDPLGVDTLMAAVRDIAQWDKGWNYKLDYTEFRPLLSPLDHLVIILGRAGDRRAVPLIVEKLQLLTAADDFSHHRAVVLALETLADPAAAKPLAELLTKPGMSGHAYASIEVARQREKPGGDYNVVKNRRESLRELMIARALYRCGDYQGLGEKTLRHYAEDLRGHLSRHAQAVLTRPSGAAAPPSSAR
ncbi:MAG: FAD-dependent oxidoreductase [Kiritimatiellaeota bacterium]|nr:FAD-dependent oxidoreductase [Kiritimatiellota bacterium]